MRTLNMPSAVQRILIGGDRGMVGDAKLVDARTGAIIIATPGISTVMYTGQGIAGSLIQAAVDSNSERSPVDKVFDNFGQTYRDWLLRDRGAFAR
jgi:hypothetical protein